MIVVIDGVRHCLGQILYSHNETIFFALCGLKEWIPNGGAMVTVEVAPEDSNDCAACNHWRHHSHVPDSFETCTDFACRIARGEKVEPPSR